MTVKARPILNLGSKTSAPDVVVRGQGIVDQMGLHVATFATPSPPLTAITDQIGKVQIKLGKQNAAWLAYKAASEDVKTEKIKLLDLLELLRVYVEITADGDVQLIKNSGYDVRQTGVSSGILPAPLGVITKEGTSEGELIVTWRSVKGAKAYNVEISYDHSDAANWTFYGTVAKCKCFVTGIESGTRVYTRVVAINGKGNGGYSDISTKTVP
jgi:hypothetical protein